MTKLFSIILLLVLHSAIRAQVDPDNFIALDMGSIHDVELFDLDEDGDLDVVGLSTYPDMIFWIRNEGGFVFSQPRILEANGENHYSLEILDLNEDGLDDLIVATGSSVRWSQNLGGGDLTQFNTLFVTPGYTHDLQMADMDGDGDLDIIFDPDINDEMRWYENDSGAFPTSHFIATVEVEDYDVADIDGDQDMDVMVVTDMSGWVRWYENQGDGFFSYHQLGSESSNNSVQLVDLDLDGDQDVLVSDYGDLAFYENEGNGEFLSPVSIIGWYELDNIEAADFDNDGDLDLIGVDNAGTAGSCDLWIQDGEMEFTLYPSIAAPYYYNRFIRTGDLDNDGFLDAVLVDEWQDGGVLVLPISGAFESITPQNISTQRVRPIGPVRDSNGDGYDDVLVMHDGGSYDARLQWLNHLGDGNFVLGGELMDDQPTFDAHEVDVDDDGDMDLVFEYSDDIFFRMNIGDSLFEEPLELTTGPGTWGHTVYILALEDFDGDGDEDVIFSQHPSGEGIRIRIYWVENLGSGEFSYPHLVFSSESVIGQPYYADLDMDGLGDFLLSSYAGFPSVGWIQQQNDGTFSEVSEFQNLPAGASTIFADDADQDGDMDVVLKHSELGLCWLENQGDLVFDYPITFYFSAVSNGYLDLHLEDLNNDGIKDLSGRHGGDIFWCMGLPEAGFGSKELVVETGLYPYFELFDYNQDEFPDFAIRLYDQGILLHENDLAYGCMNSVACNFNPYAIIDDGSCCLGTCGCIDALASNYDPDADCDDESCEYRLNGIVFFDENENASFDEEEYGLPMQEVWITPNDWTSITDDNGEFYLEADGTGEFYVYLITGESFPYVTTPNPNLVPVVAGVANDTILIGVSNEEPDFGICIDFYPPGNFGYPCNDLVNHNICFRNESGAPIDGYIELELDPLFQGYEDVTPIDSVVDGKIYMGFENLLPGEMYFYDILLHTPTSEYIGQYLSSVANAYGYYEGEEVAFGTKSLLQEMTCSYDPNDKQVFPNGYAEPHYILPETELEYLVRFQNTGNAPAINVLIRDTIDDNLDLESFKLVANSHSVKTTIKHDDRVIEFLFEEIMLPDSTSNEPESHGLVSYKLRPYNDLLPETEINNTAYIFFDNNDPIITNTTWNTIYECTDELASFDVSPLVICEGQDALFTCSNDLIESYSWTMDGEVVGIDASVQFRPEISSGQIYLQVQNPLCIAHSSLEFLVYQAPDANFAQYGRKLVAIESSAYQWYRNGAPMVGETNRQLIVTVDGSYAVQTFNEHGCFLFSPAMYIRALALNPNPNSLAIYPNPSSGFVQFEIQGKGNCEISVFDMTGRIVLFRTNQETGLITLDLSALATGQYQIKALTSFGVLYQGGVTLMD